MKKDLAGSLRADPSQHSIEYQEKFINFAAIPNDESHTKMSFRESLMAG